MTSHPQHVLAVAPMMDRTDRHFRFLMRLVAPSAWLYTEMITAAALTRGDPERFLKFDAAEHPVAIQLGGGEPAELAEAAKLAATAGFDEINLNIGCPSDRVQAGCFGAALMLEPGRVADCVRAIAETVDVPVTVKCRIGVDDRDDYGSLWRFTERVVEAGCRTLFVHARKAWLTGLSPKQNREIPPLDYARVYRLKREWPDLEVVINGGIRSAEDVRSQLAHVDGVMLGRAAYEHTMCLREAARVADPSLPSVSASQILRAYRPYVERQIEEGVHLSRLTRHVAGLFVGIPGAKKWRRALASIRDDAERLDELYEIVATIDASAGMRPDAEPELPLQQDFYSRVVP